MSGDPWVCVFIGKIVSSSRWSKTEVSSSGGGGHLYRGTGHISAPEIHTSTHDNNEIFAISDDGVEQRILLVNKNIGFRPGNKILVIWGSESGEIGGPQHYIENIDTGDRVSCSPDFGLNSNQKFLFIFLSIMFIILIIPFAIWIFMFKIPALRERRVEFFRLAVLKAADIGITMTFDETKPTSLFRK